MRAIPSLCASFFLSAVVSLLPTESQAQREGPFDSLQGSWSGGGTISFSDGSRERISCRAGYSVGGRGYELQQSLRCASDSYNFSLRSDVSAQGRSVSGRWSESTRGISGNLRGSASGNRIQVLVESSGFSATLTLTTDGNRQSVSISAPGQEMSAASITLSRR